MTHTNEFRDLGLSEQMLEAVKAKGFEIPTQVQKLTIPKLLQQTNDLIAQSQTGTGKTAAYGLPMLQELTPSGKAVQAIILVPTRELALQVMEELISYNSVRRLSIAAIYGGASMSEQLRRLSKGIDIVVGTPGRVLDHIRRGTLKLAEVKYLVLDEADEMLNMGFIEDVEEIISHTAEQRRILLFSATMPDRIVKLSKKYMKDAEVVKTDSRQITADLTDQIYFEVREDDKLDALTRIIDIEPEFYGIVFCRTKIGVDELVNKLLERGYAAEALHGDVSQAQREKILKNFKNKRSNILVATDVAARGIDINNLTHVINYSLPQDTESYVHRIGRTGRAGNQGTAITFLSSSEMRRFGYLKKELGVEIKKETLPSGQDVVAIKRRKIKDDLQEIIDGNNWADYGDMADELLAAYPPEIALSALLKLAFRSELDQSAYPEIRSFSVDRKGTARVFIAVGRNDGYDIRKLITLLKRECGLKDNKITDVKLMDDFSFVSVPFVDAEHVIRKLNQIRRGDNRPLAKIAKPLGEEGGGKQRQPRKGQERDSAGENKTRRQTREQDNSVGGKVREARAKSDEEPRVKSDAASRENKPAKGKAADSAVPSTKSARAEAIDKKKTPKGKAQGDSDWYSAEEAKPAYVKAPKKEKPMPAGEKPAKERRKTVDPEIYRNVDSTPSEKANSGFDWSIFEGEGNAWGHQERKGKKGKK